MSYAIVENVYFTKDNKIYMNFRTSNDDAGYGIYEMFQRKNTLEEKVLSFIDFAKRSGEMFFNSNGGKSKIYRLLKELDSLDESEWLNHILKNIRKVENIYEKKYFLKDNDYYVSLYKKLARYSEYAVELSKKEVDFIFKNYPSFKNLEIIELNI